MHNLAQSVKFVKAVAPTVTLGTGAAITGIEVDCTGYDRACYVLYWGTQAGATKSGLTSLEVDESDASGGTFAQISSSDTSIGTDGTSNVKVIDIPVTYNKPYQKLAGTSGTEGTSAVTVAAVAILYRGTRQLPVTQALAPIVA
jgi:hypothetical protein